MSSKIKFIALFGFVLVGVVIANSNLVLSNRSTSGSPEAITYTITEPTDMTYLYENDNFTYYFRDSRDVLAIYDKRTGFTHKTGLDVDAGADIKLDCDDAVDTEDPQIIEDTCIPIEDDLNQTWTALANSLVTIEYFNDELNLKRTSSASPDYSRSSLSRISGDDHWALDIEFNRIDVDMRIHLYFNELGVEYEIKQDQITGEGVSMISDIIITPFLDAQGGKTIAFNGEEYDNTVLTDKPSNDGYILVPDGPGALLRFNDNEVDISEYHEYAYGIDLSRVSEAETMDPEYFAPKQMTLPVFGIALGNDTETAFVAYATSGAENFKVSARPSGNTTWYNFAYGAFSYNEKYFQEVNNFGDGFSTLGETPNNDVNFKIQYQFLAGDGSTDYEASYVGMAQAYRDYLVTNGLTAPGTTATDSNIPMRVDFLMADVRKDLFGYEDVVVTTLSQVETIYQSLFDNNLRNINSGLIGYTSGGVTAGGIGDSNVSGSIGGKSGMKSLLEVASEFGYDVSFQTDYINTTELQDNSLFSPAPAKHISGKYMVNQILDYQTINEYYYTRFDKAIDWLNKDVNYTNNLDMNSISIDGLSYMAYSEYERGVSRTDNINELLLAMSEIEIDINAVNPNAYLLPYVDRYLEAPIYSTHFLIETDTVPFLQLVLSDSMEMYAHYANFNVTNQDDILRMIDYNVYPSFILTNDPSYELEDTNSFLFYSTQYSFYEEEIQEVYNQVNDVLKHVEDQVWIDRTVIEEGVVRNDYTGGVSIIINYNNQTAEVVNNG